MYVLAKCQLRILKAFEVKPYEVAATERSICTVSIGKNKLTVLLKTDVTYEWSYVRTRILHHHVRHVDYWVSYFFYSLSSPQIRSKYMKKH